ncbi:hypothetical protein BFW01_g3804 [Lasiodiplodia theobromae]|nr:hypothetical protein BFW01_g3804 [Lasiodiplodia theobromae]
MQRNPEPIAIVGSACRFPGSSTSPSKLWELLKQPRDVLSNIDRFKAKSFYHQNGHYHGASNVRQSYLLNDDPCAFDAQFFNIQAAEADSIDPQQRLLLESVYESIESAGLKLEDLQGSRTAVYVGVMCDDYAEIVYHDVESIPKYAATGSARSIMSNRISYFFDWHGPSMTIDTACSSSLVAVHQAVQVLRSGESNVAVAAGANLIFGPKMYIAESNLNMLSPTGRSRMWDANADGYARGEGIGAVVLKTLSAALADGDDIECIIRETGVNQDGRTPGITMPSASAQADLIAQTYARAGLDPRKETDRCQYFEAHGTGTKAGDPQEASAICEAFFGGAETPAGEVPLWVGSIKTVIGHTEGTAGIAGLLKASLAVQNKMIPPNMHFNRLNPDVAPYYSNLRIPTELQTWPALPAGTPRRVSVNSFGFGGTNAHAIVESYEKPAVTAEPALPLASSGPFVFSANSVRSLKDVLAAHADFLRSGAEVDLRTLAWTLHHRRSAFPVRTSVAAQSVEELCERLDAQREEASFVRAATKSRRIVGIFTGQGAQWAAMGRGLVLASKAASQTLAELEQALAELPESERPEWSLREQLLAPAETSRVREAALSQPLCTAVQVLLVDLLYACGISFEAVVGHSSGEIGAAYAAGFLSARDAIRIAYLRGLHATGARGGAMLAAGTSMADASELCALPFFRGRLCVAASNSSASVTLSGDASAVDRAQLVMEDESKFARRLVVDTAYHSHHMLPCLPGYIASMRRAGIQLRTPPANAPRWFSSVLDGREMNVADVDVAQYWADNMARPVLFSQALTAAVSATGAPAVAIEVGPHPALRGPASLTIEEMVKGGCPYTGTIKRGSNDVEALADCVGFIWSHLGSAAVDLERFDEAFSGPAPRMVPKGLPQYPWDHDRTFWSESRESRMVRLRDDPVHALLGTRCPSDAEGQHRWRNYLKPTELPWLRGHQIQGQTLFPAAGFACMALEACRALATPEETRLIEITDFSIHRALSFFDDSTGVETLFCLTNVRTEAGHVVADFSCDASLTKDSGFTSVANGKLRVTLGSPAPDCLPARPAQLADMAGVDVDTFYASLRNTGYNYSGMFQAITSLERTRDAARGTIFVPREGDEESTLVLHPAPLDVAFQAIFAALASPGDGDLWTLHIPTLIERIRLNPSACMGTGCLELPLAFEADLALADGIRGDVVVRDGSSSKNNTIVQIEGLHVSPLATPTAKDDRQLVAETLWGPLSLDLEGIYQPWVLTDDEAAASALCERTCLFYLRRLHETITPEERERCNWHQARVLEWAAHAVALAAAGQHPTCKKEWLDDSYEFIQAEVQKMMDRFQDFQIVLLVGETLVPFVRGETTILEQFRSNNLLDHFYRDSIGLPEYNTYLGQVADQLAHRYPSMDFLEIGAGTGSAANAILKRIGRRYGSYTYTDISAAFFEDAQRLFADHNDRFTYKTLDVEQDPTDQGFPEHAYDVIVASNVLHATRSLENTLRNARRLLKPGGHLLLLEITNNRPLRISFIFSGLPGWWVGEEEGRRLTPLVTRREWDAVLRRAGFAGVDTTTPSSKNDLIPFSVMAAQAVDSHISLLREPLAHPASAKPVIDNLVIVGGATFATSRLVQAIGNTVAPYCRNITAFDSLEAVDYVPPKATVLNVSELETAFFNPFTARKLESAKYIFDAARLVLWVTQGNRADDPYANMMYGVARCLASEMKRTLRMQMLDFDTTVKPDAQLIAASLLRLQIGDSASQRASSTLWSIEHELSVTSSGAIEVPRYRPSQGPNDRFNSTRRPITAEVSLEESVVDVVRADDDTLELREGRFPGADETAGSSEYVDIRVLRSTASALQIGRMGFLFLVVGVDRASGQTLLALAPSCSSAVRVPKAWTAACDNVPEDKTSQLLVAAASSITAAAILAGVEQGGSLLVHQPAPLLAALLEKQAAEKQIKLALTTSSDERYDLNGQQPTIIHPWAPERAARQCVPQDISLLVDLAASEDAVHLGKFAPRGCTLMDASSLLSSHASTRAAWPADELAACLSTACAQAQQPELLSSTDATEVPVGSLAGRRDAANNATLEVVDWTATASVTVSVRPVESTVRFRSDRTYFLLGMTGDLGRSLCRWMVERGAKHFALCSRRPNEDQAWVKMMRAAGVVLNMFAVDVTSKDSVLSAHREICRTMPPIAGVANAAMVLEDLLFSNMDYETMNKVLRPKVDGSRILDELFPTNDLDFFILFSSLASVTGNYGQSPYAAANSYMCALAHGRRKRGLVASVMNLAGIKGLGYIHRTDETILDRLDTMGYATVSERDFLTFFAECVEAGRPESGRNPELSAGLQSFDPTYAHAPAWIDNPKFAHYRQSQRNSAAAAVDAAGRPKDPVKKQLLEVESMEEAEQVLQEAFLATLQQTLKLPDDGSLTADTPVVSLGVDSLVAVDMRSWFANELDLDMPVLKILGGATVAELVEDAVARMSPELVPKAAPAAAVEENAGSDSTSEEESAPENAGSGSEDVSSDDDNSSVLSEEIPALSEHEAEEDEDCSGAKVEELVPLPTFEKTVPMAYASTRFWFLQQYLDDPTAFNLVFRARITGPLRVHDLQRAASAVAERHEAFRTAFFSGDDGAPMQGVLPFSSLRLETSNIIDEQQVLDACRTLSSHRYDIERGETARLMLLSNGPTTHHLLFGFHHIAIDGFSFNVFLYELDRAYRRQSLPPVAVQFGDFATRQRRAVESGQLKTHLDFWKNEYPDCPQPLPLFPLAQRRTRQALTRYECAEATVTLGADLAKRIKDQARRHRATSFHFFLAALKVLLFRWLEDTDDVSIGLADANRTDGDTAGTIGFLLNLLPLRMRRSPNDSSFADVLTEARTKAYSALAHSAVPFDVLLEELAIQRSSTHSPLFQVFFDYRQLAIRTEKALGAELEGDATLGNTAYDVTLDITDYAGGEISVSMKTQKYLYPQRAAELLLRSYIRMLEVFAARPDARESEPALFDDAAVQEALDAGRGPAMELTWPATVSQRIDVMAAQNPERTAIRDGHGANLTYSTMDARCNAISAALEEHGVTEGSSVALLQEPTANWACSVLGVWRAGCAYVPLDTRHTPQRIAAVLSDCRASAILCDARTFTRAMTLSTPDMAVINVDMLAEDATPRASRARPEEPAAILYTSGSTGVPKGIMLRHSGIRNNIEGTDRHWGVGRETVLQQSACTFDMSLRQLLTALTHGGTLYVASAEARRDPAQLTSLLASEGISWTVATPSEYQAWLAYGAKDIARATNWRFATSGGEAFTRALRDDFVALANPLLRVFNAYGPSEITFSCAEAEIPSTPDAARINDGAISLGRPLPNYTIRIVDENLRPLPAGVAGEIVVGGPSVAAGYVDTALNAAKFIPDLDNAAVKAFRTGDVGHLGPDGTLFFHGRVADDAQVKLRGIRIELGDVESAVVKASDGAVAAAVASVRGNPPFLVAHVEFAADGGKEDENKNDFLAATLKPRLAQALPQYMVPATLVPVDRLPLTAHGKLDRRAAASLPLTAEEDQSSATTTTTTTLTPDQIALERLWRAVVSADAPHATSADTSFFDVGGNSLLLVKLAQLIRDEFGAAVPLRQLLEDNTLGAMAAAVKRSAPASVEEWVREDTVAPEPLDLGGAVSTAAPRAKPEALRVLLTGATGYLGRRILSQLVADERVAEVHCLAVRQPSSLVEQHAANPKVVVHIGDLTSPRLGLSEDAFAHLAASADAVVHSAANRSFWDHYEHLRATNVASTRELVRLAAPRGVPLHFVSSAGALALDEAKDAGSGYVLSKWASERLLADAAARLGLPVRVHRAMPIEEGAWGEEVPAELLSELRDVAKVLRALPETSADAEAGAWAGSFDLVRVEELAREIGMAVVGDDDYEAGAVVECRYPSTVRLSMADVAGLVEKEVEEDKGEEEWSRLPPHEWAGKAKKVGFGWHFAALDASIAANGEGLAIRR